MPCRALTFVRPGSQGMFHSKPVASVGPVGKGGRGEGGKRAEREGLT